MINWTHEAKRALGLNPHATKLPTDARHGQMSLFGAVYRVELLPLTGEAPLNSAGRPRRRMGHRVRIECPTCGCLLSAGRFGQHVCEQNG